MRSKKSSYETPRTGAAVDGGGLCLSAAGGRHDIYLNPATGKKQPIPRHNEVDEHLARHICRVLGVSQ